MEDNLWDQFFKQQLGLKEALQIVEDALTDAGYDRYSVATERGTFIWRSAEQIRVEPEGQAREPPPRS